MKLEDFPSEVIFAMPQRDWQTCAWNAAKEGVLRGPARVVSVLGGIWTVSCDLVSDMVELTEHDEVLYRLKRYDALRPLPPVRALSPVPSRVTAYQARLHPSLNKVYAQTAPTAPETPVSAAHLGLFRIVDVQKMPAKCWHELVWRSAVGPGVSSRSCVSRVCRGVWAVSCQDEETAQAIDAIPNLLAMIRWFSRYRPTEAVKIHKTICPSMLLAN